MSDFTSNVGGQFGSILGMAMAASRATSSAGRAELEAQVRKLAADYKDLLETYDRSIAKWENAVAAAKEVIAQRDAAIGRLNASIDQANVNATQFVAEIASLKRDLSQAKREREDSDRKFSLLARRYGDLEKENARLKATVASATTISGDDEALKSASETMVAELSGLRRANAANLALRCALEVQLLRADPNNPILSDEELRKKVCQAGENAAAMLASSSDSMLPDAYDVSREAGLTFAVPGRASGPDAAAEVLRARVCAENLAGASIPAARALSALISVLQGESPVSAAQGLLQTHATQTSSLPGAQEDRIKALALDAFRADQVNRSSQKGSSMAAVHAPLVSVSPLMDAATREGILSGSGYSPRKEG